MLTAFRKIFLSPAAEAVGTVGNSEHWVRRVFQARWERWKNRCLFFHGFHGAAVSTAFLDRTARIDLGNPMSTKIDLPDPIGQGGPQGHRISPKRFAEPKGPVVEGNLAVVSNRAHDGLGTIVDVGQDFRKRAGADLITTGRHRHPQSLVGALVIIDLAPQVKAGLHRGVIPVTAALQHFQLQGAMEALFLALSLRMIRATMTDANAQAQQPDGQRGIGMVRVISPRRPVIHQHALRQSIATKRFPQDPLNGLARFIPAGLQTQRIPRMIIRIRQGMATLPIAQAKVAFEVHLPQLIGGHLLKPLPGPMLGRCGRVYASLTPQNLVNRTRGGNACQTQGLQARLDLPGPPSWMAVPQADNLLFHLAAGPSGRLARPTAAILQTCPPFGSIPLQPPVPLVPTDAKTLAQSGDIHVRLTGQLHKLPTQRHDRHLFPGHGYPPSKISMSLSMCHPCLRRLSPISPVYTHGERVPEGRVRGPLLAERRFGDTHIFPSCRTSMASPSSAARRTPRSAA